MPPHSVPCGHRVMRQLISYGKVGAQLRPRTYAYDMHSDSVPDVRPGSLIICARRSTCPKDIARRSPTLHVPADFRTKWLRTRASSSISVEQCWSMRVHALRKLVIQLRTSATGREQRSFVAQIIVHIAMFLVISRRLAVTNRPRCRPGQSFTERRHIYARALIPMLCFHDNHISAGGCMQSETSMPRP